jgi:glycosyltransferase involved in cell wall biosynthesis
MGAPRVSVVIPAHDGGLFLAEAIHSIRSQSFEDFEVVIVDDGSDDDSPRVLDRASKLDRRIRRYRQDRSGLVVTLNRACNLARGKLLARMGADNVAAPERLALQVARVQSDPNIGVLGGNVVVINKDGDHVCDIHYPASDISIRIAPQRGSTFAHPVVMMRRAAFEKVGRFRSAFVDAEYYDLWPRFAERYQVINLAIPLLRYRVHSAQSSQATNNKSSTPLLRKSPRRCGGLVTVIGQSPNQAR